MRTWRSQAHKCRSDRGMPDLIDQISFPFASPPTSETAGAVEASTTYTSVVSGAANTKGNWVQLIASTAKDICGLLIGSKYPSVACDIDIGIGGAGSETVLVPDILIQASTGTPFDRSLFVPIFIPVGTRIAVRAQSTNASVTFYLAFILLQQACSPNRFPPSGFPSLSFGGAENAGFAAASTGGTTITAGASAHVKGSWTQLIASTTRRVGFIIASVGKPSSTSAVFLIDIGTGGAGSETVIVSDLERYICNTAWWTADGFPFLIPAGTRIAARCQSSVGGATIQMSLSLLEVV
jgi:hypothetical protein